MQRRPVIPGRRNPNNGGIGALTNSVPRKLRSSPFLGLLIVAVLLLLVYSFRNSGELDVKVISRIEGDDLCTKEVQQAIPILKKVYGDEMHKVLHVGPDTCLVVPMLLKGEETEAWGVEPYDIEDADANCRALVHKGIVRVMDVKYPLPYRPKSFSLVLVSDALEYLSPKHINKTLPDLVRVAANGLTVFTGYPDKRKAKAAEVSKFGRAAKRRGSSWWTRLFQQNNLELNEVAMKKFKKAAKQGLFSPHCQIFHLKPNG